MKSRKYMIAMVVVASLVAFVAVQARADYVFDADFSGNNPVYSAAPVGAGGYGSTTDNGGVYLTTSSGGQNGWQRPRAPSTVVYPPFADIKLYTGVPGNTGAAIHEHAETGNTNGTKIAEHYLFDDHSYRTFTAADTAIEYHMWVYTAAANRADSVVMGLSFNDPTQPSGVAGGYVGGRGRLNVGGNASVGTPWRRSRMEPIGIHRLQRCMVSRSRTHTAELV